MSAFDELMAFQRETEALAQIAGRLGWDQETVMPRGSADQRGEEMAAIESVLHARRTDPRLAGWLSKASDAAGNRALDLISRAYLKQSRVPARLATELARMTSVAQGIWADARKTEDVRAFLPTLEKIVALVREKGQALADGGDVYDALLDEYEPETSGQDIAGMFAAMRPRLVALREAVLGAAHQPAPLTGRYDKDAQLALSRALADAFGYDWSRGRLDLAVHPFSSGSGNDVRITTRVNEVDPFNCFYSTIHEVGHAAYELAIDQTYLLTPLGQGVSMGVHESQSRIYENQIGRSRAFTGWMFAKMKDSFGDLGLPDAEAFYGAVNKVNRGYIRTEADEIQYNLHIMIRFDLERELMAGRLEVRDLEEAWNARFLADFGYPIDKPSNGMLQDVHWSSGAIGYFPTYSLGNLYAGCLHQALRAAVPDLDQHLAKGEARPATDWLGANLQRFGGLRAPRATIEKACGFAPSAEPLLSYLETKFRAIYRL